jgi:biopolymer transport protein ExbB
VSTAGKDIRKMKIKSAYGLLFLLGAVCLSINLSYGQDMRVAQIQAQQQKAALLEKAAAEKKAAEIEAAQSRKRILEDRSQLEKAVAGLQAENVRLRKTVRTLETQYTGLKEQEDDLSGRLAEIDGVMRELVGVIRVNAKDIDTLVEQNMVAALEKKDASVFLKAIAGQSRFPGMQDVQKMVELLRRQIRSAGDVRVIRGPIIDRSGSTVQADLLLLGNFTAAYRTADEAGFLNYSAAGRKLFALSRLPSRHLQKQIRRYMDGKQDTAPIDVTRGGALSQLTHELRLWDQIPKGGPIVWPILAILVVGIAIVVERIVFLRQRSLDADDFTRNIENLVVEKNWDKCKARCREHADKPVARVVAAGMACWHMQREAMENALQEAILREVPPMERFLSTLGMLAAIAPLLGLLGTVTGMIDTFHVITRHGTGDPRMMSGGISEALVTTMLGLSVAIPIMLAHTLLNRAVDTRIGQMEEKAVAMVNIVHRNRNADD